MRLIRPLTGFRAGRTSRVGQAFNEKKRSVRAKGWHMEPVCISRTGSWGNRHLALSPAPHPGAVTSHKGHVHLLPLVAVWPGLEKPH